VIRENTRAKLLEADVEFQSVDSLLISFKINDQIRGDIELRRGKE
jgi:hypothetical protein